MGWGFPPADEKDGLLDCRRVNDLSVYGRSDDIGVKMIGAWAYAVRFGFTECDLYISTPAIIMRRI